MATTRRQSSALEDAPAGADQKLKNRLLWFVALWLLGVATVSLLAYLIRWMIMPG